MNFPKRFTHGPLRELGVPEPSDRPSARSKSTPPCRRLAVSLLTLAFIQVVATADTAATSSGTIDFAKDIRPLLEARCFECHGPTKQKADLRLDRRSSALKGGENGPAIVPGNSATSLLISHITATDPAQVMPPKGERLTDGETARIRQWVEQGAPWPEEPGGANTEAPHWAFQPVATPPIPSTSTTATHGSAAPVDAFIAERLGAAGLSLSPEAPRHVLIRRLFLVLLGVHPTLEEVRAFVADPRSDAYERLVDQVLNDPRYGERWARHWLDVVRFAESNGFETNRERPNAWRFRDYVIAAFNHDLPYDQFVREQIAGDALGVPIATGFLVGGPVDIVGSPDPVLTAQQRADELDDMVNTTGTAFLGLTLGCARCHSHKFDPIEQREYYSLTAVFAGVRHGESALPLPPDQAAEKERAASRVADLEGRLRPFLAPTLPATNELPSVAASGAKRPPVTATLNTEEFPPIEARRLRFTILASSSGEPCLDELEVYSGDRNVALSSKGTKATASGTLPGYDIHKLEHLNDGQVGNSRSWISDTPGKGWIQLDFPQETRIDRIVWSRDRNGGFRDRLPAQYRIEIATTAEPERWVLVASSADRTPIPAAPVTDKTPPVPYRFDGFPPTEAEQGRQWLAELEKAKANLAAASKPPMAYAGQFNPPGLTYRLHRGDPMQKRELVTPATLSLFRPLVMSTNEPEQRRRLQLADWIASPDHPLTARVLVNRVWQHHFGVGLVDTPNDFGRNGARPTHPELLDWLAADFMRHGWSIKALQRRIVLSHAWRQSNAPRAEALAVDAADRLLWRFPPRRLEAEAIRDCILEASGALVSSGGGPSFHLHEVDRENVYHYQPKERFGPEEFRRMVYAYKVRMEHDGIFGSFDCPDGSLVAPRRSISTTPLQALNLFNSAFVLDQAERLSDRLAREAGPELQSRVQRAWQLVFQRDPGVDEARDAVQLAEAHGVPALARALLNANEFLFIP
ncbi:MAG: DUF1553 domain-containing protein [Verrucomicrobiales bacterium]|nr:DUF1553 domain-containing protein [Verrucomicrobiales bacterium]